MIDRPNAKPWQHPALVLSIAAMSASRPTLCCLLMMAVLAARPALAEDNELSRLFAEGRPTTTLDIDNDSLLLTNDDGGYTSGLRLSQDFRLRERDGWRTVGWRIGQQLYTARNTRLTPAELGPLDRPYAGWLYAGMVYRREQADGSEVAWGLDIGCLGPCAQGRHTQEFLHRVLSQPQPQAWASQLSTEPGVVLHVGGRAPYLRLASGMDLRPGIAARAGNIFTDLSGDLMLRFGQLQPSASGATYGYLRASLRGVVHDATLQGGWIGSETRRTVSPERLTGEIEAGLQWQQARWSLRASIVTRSNEIRGLSDSDGRQSFVRISIGYTP